MDGPQLWRDVWSVGYVLVGIALSLAVGLGLLRLERRARRDRSSEPDDRGPTHRG